MSLLLHPVGEYVDCDRNPISFRLRYKTGQATWFPTAACFPDEPASPAPWGPYAGINPPTGAARIAVIDSTSPPPHMDLVYIRPHDFVAQEAACLISLAQEYWNLNKDAPPRAKVKLIMGSGRLTGVVVIEATVQKSWIMNATHGKLGNYGLVIKRGRWFSGGIRAHREALLEKMSEGSEGS